jgi:hypothetical protein
LLVDKFHEGVLVHFAEVLRRNWKVGILRGEFTKFQELSDLPEEKEGYSECFSKCKLRRNRAIGTEPTGVVGSLV